MASLEELQAQRTRTIQEIQRRKKAGQKETPDLTARLATVENQIRSMRGSQGETPAAGGPPQVGDIKTTQEGINADAAIADYSAGKQLGYQNPNQVNPFGTQTTTRDANGNIVVESKLSEGQQKIAGQDESLTQMGNDMAQSRLQGSNLGQGWNPAVGQRQNTDPSGVLSNPFQAQNLTQRNANTSALDASFRPELTARTNSGDTVADRRRIEDQVFASLTRNIDRDSAREKDNFEQSLANRGIPIDPTDPQYKEALRQHNERFDTLRSNALQDAVKMGGDEYSRSSNINETMRANDFSQQIGARSQNAGEASTLSGIQEGQRSNDFGQQLNTNQQNAALAGQGFNQQETANANDFSQNQAVRNQNLNEVGALSGLGTGLQVPNFQPYQAPNFQVQPATTTAATVAGIDQGQQALTIQQQTAKAQQAALRAQAAQAALSGRGGNSQPQTPQPPPFS